MTRFRFRFAAAYLPAGAAFGVTPWTAWVDLTPAELSVRYGPWTLRTATANIARARVTGDFAYLKTAGPPHLSFADRGISFAPNGERAVCLLLHDPVPGIDPTGLLDARLRHPGVTLGVADVDGLLAALAGTGVPGSRTAAGAAAGQGAVRRRRA